jgi:hypothetical protein
MRWFQGALGRRINGPFDMAVLRLVDRRHHVEVAFPVLFLPNLLSAMIQDQLRLNVHTRECAGRAGQPCAYTPGPR